MQLFTTLWTVAHQASLSMGIPKQEHWSGLWCSPPGCLSDPETEPASLEFPALVGGFFTTSATWEDGQHFYIMIYWVLSILCIPPKTTWGMLPLFLFYRWVKKNSYVSQTKERRLDLVTKAGLDIFVSNSPKMLEFSLQLSSWALPDRNLWRTAGEP